MRSRAPGRRGSIYSTERVVYLAHLAASLLDMSRRQAGARAVFPRPAHVGEVVAAALEALGPQPKPVLADIPSGLPEVMADPAIAEWVIVNLAGNALRYSPATAPPLLTARTAGNRVILRRAAGVTFPPS
jgi:two-component system sensor histidine kinase KdpD